MPDPTPPTWDEIKDVFPDAYNVIGCALPSLDWVVEDTGVLQIEHVIPETTVRGWRVGISSKGLAVVFVPV